MTAANHQTPLRLIGVDGMMQRYRCGRSTLWRWERDNLLPKSARWPGLGKQWSLDAVEDWEKRRLEGDARQPGRA